jgi:hypothetical protein
MGWACGTHGSEEKYIQGFGEYNCGKNHLEGIGIDGRIILK